MFGRYTSAICREIELREIPSEKIRSIYFGGGTPSILPIEMIEKIFNSIPNKKSSPEITIEANPGTVDKKYLRDLRRIGFNRISFGVQSFNDRILKSIGRIHTSRDALDSIDSARLAGFKNINIDLIYALPNQTIEDLQNDLDIIAALDIQHVSIYGLQIEEGTRFSQMKLDLPSDEITESMYDLIVSELPRLGFHRYEISNYAKDGFESRQNLGYWSDIPYIGFGSAAHSYLNDDRIENFSNVEEYIDAIESGKIFYRAEDPNRNRNDLISEFCFLGLRKTSGIDRSQFKNKFGDPIEKYFQREIDRLISKNLLEVDEKSIRLTPLGMKFGNLAFEEFLL